MKPVIIIAIAFVLLFALIPTASLAFGESSQVIVIPR